jgi:hypothetical protein
MFAGIRDTALSSVEARATPYSAWLSNARIVGYVLLASWDAGQERFVQKRTASE